VEERGCFFCGRSGRRGRMIAVYCHYRDRRYVILLYRGGREKQRNRVYIYFGANIVCSAVKRGKRRKRYSRVGWDRQIWKLANNAIA